MAKLLTRTFMSALSVVQPHYPGRILPRGEQAKLAMHAIRQRPLAATEGERIDEQMQLIDEVVLEKRVEELARAVEEDVLAGLLLQLPHRARHVVADDRGVAPDRFLQRARDNVLLGRSERILGRIGLERLAVDHIGAPAEEQRIDL